MSVRSLDEISKTSDADIVRIWLAERGLVAVQRTLMDKLVTLDGPAVYFPGKDRYYDRIALSASVKSLSLALG